MDPLRHKTFTEIKLLAIFLILIAGAIYLLATEWNDEQPLEYDFMTVLLVTLLFSGAGYFIYLLDMIDIIYWKWKQKKIKADEDYIAMWACTPDEWRHYVQFINKVDRPIWMSFVLGITIALIFSAFFPAEKLINWDFHPYMSRLVTLFPLFSLLFLFIIKGQSKRIEKRRLSELEPTIIFQQDRIFVDTIQISRAIMGTSVNLFIDETAKYPMIKVIQKQEESSGEGHFTVTDINFIPIPEGHLDEARKIILYYGRNWNFEEYEGKGNETHQYL